MARGKKNESALTLEDKLARALVPDWEQPYPVPGNWCFFYFTSLIDIEGGTQPPKSQFIDEPREGYVRLIQIRDFATDKNTVYVPDSPKMRHLEKNDILIARYGASLGRICTGQKGVYNVALAKTIFSESALNRKYVYWMLQSETFQTPLTQLSRTAQAGFNKDDLSGFAMPLPPLAEQQRIVDRIENLFAKLDEAKEKAQLVLDSFETRKVAILHKAFTGELTAKWREEHSIGMESWEQKRINQVTKPRAGYAFDSKKFTDNGYQIVRMGNLYGGELNLSRNPVFISENDVDESILKRALINAGDILITLTGTKYKRDYGYAVCVSTPNKLLVNQRILCLTPSGDVECNYILYYLKSNMFRDVFFSNETGGVNQGNVSSKFVEKIEIIIPTLDEQHEIVTILDRVMANEQHAKDAAEAVLEKIDLLKKSILARAFRGELGTNDPSEGSALDLLKSILQEDAPAVTRTRSKSIPKELQAKLATDLERQIVKLYFKQETESIPAEELLSVSSKKFEVMNSLHNLEQRRILKKLPNGNYRLME